MPKIPIQQQPQILNASSPVPIAGTGEARMEGEAISQFGRGLASFADAREKTKNLLAQVQMEEADSEFDTMTREAIDLARGQIKDNPGMFGDQARKDFVAAHKEKMTAIAERVENPLYKRMWLAKANQKLTAFGEEVGNEQWKNQVKHAGDKTLQTVDTVINIAATDPLRRDEAIIKAQNIIDTVGDEIFAPSVKQSLRDGLEKKVDVAIIEGFKAKGRKDKMDGWYDLAEKHLDAYAAKYDPEVVDKLRDGISKDRITMLSEASREEAMALKKLKMEEEKTQRINGPIMLQKLMKAKTPNEVRQVLDEMFRMKSERLIDGPTYSLGQTFGTKVTKETSSLIEGEIRTKIYQKVPKNEILNEVLARSHAGQLSDEAKIRILSRLEKREQRSPEETKRLLAYARAARRPHEPNPNDWTMKPEDRNKLNTLADKSEATFWEEYERNGEDPIAALRRTHDIMQTQSYGLLFQSASNPAYVDKRSREREKERLLKAYTTYSQKGEFAKAKQIMKALADLHKFDQIESEKSKTDQLIKEGQPVKEKPKTFFEKLFGSDIFGGD